MRDLLLEKFFESHRWEKALDVGVGKGISKSELRALTAPEVRLAMYRCIRDNQYLIAPPHQAKILKENGDFRIVYINENVDRIFLSIVNDMLFELFPEMIHPQCKSYQTGIGCGKVVQEVSSRIQRSHRTEIGIKADLSKYFDSVPLKFIDEIFNKIEQKVGHSKIIDIVRKYYHTDLCFDIEGNLIEHYQSLKQGCAVASFLADALLYDIDSLLTTMSSYYVRYSDDLLIIDDYWETNQMILKEMLNEKGLTLNPKKVEVLHKDKFFKFLGFNIKNDMITLSKSRLKSFQKEIESRTIKKHKTTQTKAVNSVQSYLYKGDGTYSWATSVLPIINVQKDIDTLNEFVLDCIRACATGKKKVGGLGSVNDKPDYTILRGTGKNVAANRMKTEKEIAGYYSIRCMQNALLTNRAVYETIVRQM